jgi:hypothetical protein
MKTIQLTRGKVALVDDEDHEYLSQWKWYALKTKNAFYAVRAVRTPTGQKAVLMHRAILRCPQGKETDHIDHDGLNNQRSNLRICTKAENMHNRRPQGGASRFKGVVWSKVGHKWAARIKHTYLGLFTDEVDAARAYDRAARELFGAFARPNFPEEVVIE